MNDPYEDLYFARYNAALGIPTPKVQYSLNPQSMYFPTYAQWGADLTLSGHVHGGVVIIPFKGGLLSPERDFFLNIMEAFTLLKNEK